MRLRIRLLSEETIDGMPQLVLYFHNDHRGLILTREIASDLTAALGHHPVVESVLRHALTATGKSV